MVNKTEMQALIIKHCGDNAGAPAEFAKLTGYNVNTVRSWWNGGNVSQGTVDITRDALEFIKSFEPPNCVLPDAQRKKVKRLIDDGCKLGSVLLHKSENGHGSTAIVSPHGHVEWAK